MDIVPDEKGTFYSDDLWTFSPVLDTHPVRLVVGTGPRHQGGGVHHLRDVFGGSHPSNRVARLPGLRPEGPLSPSPGIW